MNTDVQNYFAPKTLKEALRILSKGGCTVLAGGTDLMPLLRARARKLKPVLLNIKRISEINGISFKKTTVTLGALTTVSEILNSPLIQQQVPVLSDTADCFASCQIRNAATLGGNITNASPAGDMIIPLLLLDAVVETASWKGGKVSRRKTPLCDFFKGPGKTKLGPKELLTRVSFPVPGKDFVSVFKKFGARPALDISVVSIGIAGRRENGALRQARVAFGAVAPIPMRAKKTEAAINAGSLNAKDIAAMAQTAQDEVSPISDVRASAWYRKELIKTLTKRLLLNVAKN